MPLTFLMAGWLFVPLRIFVRQAGGAGAKYDLQSLAWQCCLPAIDIVCALHLAFSGHPLLKSLFQPCKRNVVFIDMSTLNIIYLFV